VAPPPPPSFQHSLLVKAAPTRVVSAFFDPEALSYWWQAVRSVTIPRPLGIYAIQWEPTPFSDEILGPLGGAFHGTIVDLGSEGWGLFQESSLGCLCARMPAKRPWEDFAGHAGTPIAASRFADLTLRVVETLAELGLPASLRPAVLEVATLEFLDRAQPAGQDDWRALIVYVQSLPRGRVEEYVATLTATGPLVPARRPRRP